MSDLEILQEIYGDLKYWTVEELDLQFRLIALARKESKKEWVGLTKEERRSIFDSCESEDRGYVLAMTEAKLKEKNS